MKEEKEGNVRFTARE